MNQVSLRALPVLDRPSISMWRRILTLARPEASRLAWATFFLVIGSAMGLAFPQAVRVILDGLLAENAAQVLDRAALALLALFAVQGVAVALRHWLFVVAGERVVSNLRAEVFRRVMTQEVAFFDARRTGELLSRLASDASVLQNAVSINISILLRNLALLLGGIGLLAYTSWKLTLVMLAVVPPLVAGVLVYGRRVRRLSREAQDALAQAGEVAEESIGAVRTLRSFNQEATAATQYAAAMDRSLGLAIERTSQISWFTGGATFGGYAVVAGVLWLGGQAVSRGEMTIGDLLSFVLYTLFVAFSLAAVGQVWTDFARAQGAAERVFELLDREPTMPATGGDSPTTWQGAVALQDVVFRYPSRPDIVVLHGITLALQPGERVALVGQSGGGKSTIAALLGRLYDPEAGAILFDGVDVRTLDPRWLRARIAVVEQEPLLLSASIAANIRLGRADATDAEVEAAAQAANASAFIERFPEGYETSVGERGIQLSGGQKQRVAIARALLKDPAVLILDEATSALDAESEHLVREALDRLMEGRTTLIIAHRLSTVRAADRVLVIDQGRVVEAGKHDALMAQDGPYRRLVQRQQG